MTLAQEALFQRAQEEEHIGGPGVEPHEADAPRLALEFPEPATDFDAELAKQPFPYGQGRVGTPKRLDLHFVVLAKSL